MTTPRSNTLDFDAIITDLSDDHLSIAPTLAAGDPGTLSEHWRDFLAHDPIVTEHLGTTDLVILANTPEAPQSYIAARNVAEIIRDRTDADTVMVKTEGGPAAIISTGLTRAQIEQHQHIMWGSVTPEATAEFLAVAAAPQPVTPLAVGATGALALLAVGGAALYARMQRRIPTPSEHTDAQE